MAQGAPAFDFKDSGPSFPRLKYMEKAGRFFGAEKYNVYNEKILKLFSLLLA